MAEHQEMSNKMDKERKELEMAIARSMVDQQRLEAQKQTQNDLMENHMMKLSLKSEGMYDYFFKKVRLLFLALGEWGDNFWNGYIFKYLERIPNLDFKNSKVFLADDDTEDDNTTTSGAGVENKEAVKADGLYTATDVIKQEIKILENKLSDGDLLKLNNSGDQIEEQEIVTKVDDDDEIDEGLGEAKPMVLNKIKQQSDVVGLGYDEKSTYWSTSLCQRGFQNLCFLKPRSHPV